MPDPDNRAEPGGDRAGHAARGEEPTRSTLGVGREPDNHAGTGIYSFDMDTEEEVFDSPTGWVSRHIRDYVETEGRQGHRWSGVPTLLLTTRGRRTGKLRRTALIYGRDDGAYVVVGSRGGSRHHPQWYLNLVADPEVTVQVGADIFPGRAHTAEGAERQRLWRQMAAMWPDYDRYQKRTDREIPVVVIDPREN